MTHVPQARLVLQDAMFIRDKLEHEVGVTEWRLYWILAVVLLRSVGHVLDRVDGAHDARVKGASRTLHGDWKTLPEHAIFRDFIEDERNNILKEYTFSMTEGPVPVLAYLQSQDGFDTVRQFLIEENIYRPLCSGPYEGEDGRTVLDDAVEWWHVQLAEVDRIVASAAPGNQDEF
jgi:hypothetical protein